MSLFDKKYYLIGNFKSNLNYSKAKHFLKEISHLVEVNNYEKQIYIGFALCPSSLSLNLEYGKNLNIGAQNISNFESGPYTGECTIDNISDLNIKFTLVGHNERRKHFNETDEIINQKIKLCLKNNITPILCVGETLEEFNQKQTMSVIKKQLDIALKDIDLNSNILISYEPIYSVGTGLVPENCHIEHVISLIKEKINKPVLYGGSVSNNNINHLMEINSVNGFLIGKEALDVIKFESLIKKVISKQKN